jgi:hypothetical protein
MALCEIRAAQAPSTETVRFEDEKDTGRRNITGVAENAPVPSKSKLPWELQAGTAFTRLWPEARVPHSTRTYALQ